MEKPPAKSEQAKPLTVSPDEISVPGYPELLKHMVLAIFVANRLPRQRPPFSKNKIPVRSSPNKDRTDQTKFNAAMDVALAQLKKYRMITEKSSRAEVVLTNKGRIRNAIHKKEAGSRVKTARFDKIYLELVVEGRKRVRRPPKESDPSQPAQVKIENAGPQPKNVVLKPKNKPVRPKIPKRLIPKGNPVRPKFTPNRAKKPTTHRVSKAARVKRARRAIRR